MSETETIMVRIDKDLIGVFDAITDKISSEIQKKFNLDAKPKVYGTLSSKVLASWYKKENTKLKVIVRKNNGVKTRQNEPYYCELAIEETF